MKRRSSDIREGPEDLIASIQFDQWVMALGAPECAVVSHLDGDHDPARCTLCATPIIINAHSPTRGLTLKVAPDTCGRYAGLNFWLLDRLRINAQPDLKCTKFHADWWYICSKEAGILFIGDLDYPEIPAIPAVVDYINARRPLDAVLLPSYGGINPPAHRIPQGLKPTAMAEAIASVAQSLKNEGLKVGGLPHPVPAPWTDFCFIRTRLRG